LKHGPPLGTHWPYGSPDHHPGDASRQHNPYLFGRNTGFVPFGYGLPLAYGAGLVDEQEDAGGLEQPPQQFPIQAGDPPPPDEYGPEAPGQQVAENATPRYRPEYRGPDTFAPVEAQPATTLIFKDGRPAVEVHNYALTGSTLYVLDGEMRQEIPLAQLNVPATVAANRSAGIDFALPTSR
jgi:hypothetical protein